MAALLQSIKSKSGPVKIDDYLKMIPKKQINRHVHIIPKINAVYVSAPKVASTTLKGTFQKFESNDRCIRPANIHNKKTSPLKSPKDYGFSKFLSKLNNSKYKKICFVRNPYYRVLSAYIDKFVRKTPEMRIATQSKIALAAGFQPGADVSFGEFIDSIGSQKPIDMDAHWRPLTYQLMWPCIDYDFVGRMENFNEDFDKMCSFLSNDIRPYLMLKQRSNTSRTKLEDWYTKKIRDSVIEIYEEDFSVFGYPVDLELN